MKIQTMNWLELKLLNIKVHVVLPDSEAKGDAGRGTPPARGLWQW
jgi:hypothetical protein